MLTYFFFFPKRKNTKSSSNTPLEKRYKARKSSLDGTKIQKIHPFYMELSEQHELGAVKVAASCRSFLPLQEHENIQSQYIYIYI